MGGSERGDGEVRVKARSDGGRLWSGWLTGNWTAVWVVKRGNEMEMGGRGAGDVAVDGEEEAKGKARG